MRLFLLLRRGNSSGENKERCESRTVFLRHRDGAADDERG
jgi:hypothetical protein